MKISYSWIQEYIENPLPPVEEVVDALTMHSFEIEGVEDANGGDKILDVKVLPNRAHDCLSHYGVASEIAAVCDLKRVPLLPPATFPKSKQTKISIETDAAARAVAVRINGVSIGESPAWLKEKLERMGQKPINSVVDITNYLMFAFGQPTHAFDAAVIEENWRDMAAIVIRQAKKGEKITLLNGKEYELDPSIAILADKNKPLDVAGIMGGKETGVSQTTKDIVLTLCQFDAVSIRKASKRLGLQTDASKRFENDISPALIDRVLPYALSLITEMTGGQIEGGMDEYPRKHKPTVISLTARKISSILGADIDESVITSLLARQEIKMTKEKDMLRVEPPLARLDLTLPEDIAEEVGRLYGYGNIPPVPLPHLGTPEVNQIQYTTRIIRRALCTLGFSEIQTYAFVGAGDIEVENPMASDKKFLRRDLASAMTSSLEYNFKFLDLIGMKDVRLFEIGKVFTKKGEQLHLSLGVKLPKGKHLDSADDLIVQGIKAIEDALQVSIGDVTVDGGLAEIDVDRIMADMRVPEAYPADLWQTDAPGSYVPISPYPFAVRDVAVFVPASIAGDTVESLIRSQLSPIVIRLSLFDTFSKGDKTSYAFRLVFQSREKTLTDDEISQVMNGIYSALRAQDGFEIR